jgi:Met-zincin
MRVLTFLLDNRRISRLVEQEAMDGAKAYKPVEFLADLRKGIWKELDTQNVKIDAYRRNLQRGYLELIAQKLNGRTVATDDERPLLRGELKSLNTQISQVLRRTVDRTTRLHLEDVRDEIAKVLDPKFQASPSASTLIPTRTGIEDSCWPDYAITAEPRQ